MDARPGPISLRSLRLSKELKFCYLVITRQEARSLAREATMTDETRGERLQIMLTPEELMALDDFRFKNRMPSRAAAVRELLKRGLSAEGFASAAYGTKSSDYGVTNRIPEERKSAAE